MSHYILTQSRGRSEIRSQGGDGVGVEYLDLCDEPLLDLCDEPLLDLCDEPLKVLVYDVKRGPAILCRRTWGRAIQTSAIGHYRTAINSISKRSAIAI